jgi:hypothetical protein
MAPPLVGKQRLQASRAVADGIERVIGAVLEPVLEQDFSGLQGVGRIGGIDDDSVAAQIGKILDVILYVKLVGAAVAARHDDDINLGDIDHRHRIIDGRLDDVDRTVGETGALAVRAFGEFKFDIQAAFGEKAAVDRDVKRQRAR